MNAQWWNHLRLVSSSEPPLPAPEVWAETVYRPAGKQVATTRRQALFLVSPNAHPGTTTYWNSTPIESVYNYEELQVWGRIYISCLRLSDKPLRFQITDKTENGLYGSLPKEVDWEIVMESYVILKNDFDKPATNRVLYRLADGRLKPETRWVSFLDVSKSSMTEEV